MAVRVGVLALVLALAACNAGTDPGGSSSDPSVNGGSSLTDVSPPVGTASTTVPATAPPTTTPLPVDTGELGALDAALAPDGTVGLDAALALFAAGYAPLPGIVPAAQAVVDGGPVLRTLLANEDRLSAEHRGVVGRIVDPPGVPIDDVTAAPPSARLAAAAEIVRGALTSFGQRQNRPLPPEVRVTLLELPYDNGDGTHEFSSPQNHATAVPFNDGTEEYAECRIRVNAASAVDATAQFTDPVFVSALAREAYHCLQFAVAPYAQDVPLWVVEGSAAFAGEDYAGGSSAAAAWWARWLGEPQRPLDRRTSDAVGFFFMLRESADAYAFADAFLVDPSMDSVHRRLDQTDLFDRWGTHYATEPAWGPAYTFVAPGAPVLAAPQQPVTLPIDGPATVIGGSATSALAATPYRIAAPGDVLVITTSPSDRGGVRFADGQELRLAQATQSFCLLAGGCVCPGVAPDSTPISQVAGNEVFIGVGPSSGGGPQLAARSLAQWCQEVLVPAPPADALDPCLVGTWTSRAYVAPETAGVGQEVSGGSGVTLTFGADRTAAVDMNTSTPVVITATTPDGVATTTTLQYRGAGTGTWSAEAGVVNVAGIDTSTFTVHRRIETSTGQVLADEDASLSDVRLSSYASPLGTARYECTAVSLSMTHVVPGVGGEAGFTYVP